MKSFKIDDNSGIPVWIQVRKRLVYEIVSGVFKPGEQLPTVRELAVRLDINYNTVNKVYQDLERDGFIITRRGKGTFVANLDDSKLLALDSKIELLADELVSEALDFGMTADEIIEVVRKRVAQHEALASGTTTQNSKTAGKNSGGGVSGGSGRNSGSGRVRYAV